ncbi:hypothetical protein ACEV85_23270, partial [Vibrio parahaemolyticus]|uniref:hypothetical protein n=2 Tax=Vibrio parahaemolyticus TaxID=670 RepID=UPI001C60322A
HHLTRRYVKGENMDFMTVVAGLSVLASISGVTLKDLVSKVSNSDKKELENFIAYLEAKRVLVAPFDQEVALAVVTSLEDIKKETEAVRQRCSSDFVQHVLLDLVFILSKALVKLHKQKNSSDQVMFFKCLQSVRVKYAKALALLCASYDIDASQKHSDLAKFILEHSYSTR